MRVYSMLKGRGITFMQVGFLLYKGRENPKVKD